MEDDTGYNLAYLQNLATQQDESENFKNTNNNELDIFKEKAKSLLDESRMYKKNNKIAFYEGTLKKMHRPPNEPNNQRPMVIPVARQRNPSPFRSPPLPARSHGPSVGRRNQSGSPVRGPHMSRSRSPVQRHRPRSSHNSGSPVRRTRNNRRGGKGKKQTRRHRRSKKA
jgi:hypothetical protein